MIVRRVEHGEWRQVRGLRLEALQDPDAAIAFLDSYEQAATKSDDFWMTRTDNAASGDAAAQFVAIGEPAQDEAWVGTVTVLVRPAGTMDHLDRRVETARADVVGVYVAPTHRGDGTIDRLFDAAAAWAAEVGARALTLDVHADNHRAQGAYRRAGFTATGETIEGPIGSEIVMSRSLAA
ncbi:GNAT family N-acetyltransferase [Planctomonas sp. JC2975]|uniref:GNAT family N-acetyltransferase n=1 Tax=Planctomonas sp. JC2975 TaxID=2729626 RepID=UPI001854B50B|nr:GNAT family N-acetyltransferase [Planctomonas sp. JC2975]